MQQRPSSYLPQNPQNDHASFIAQQSSMAAAAMRSALNNPYGQMSIVPMAGYSSHYAQAYMQQFTQPQYPYTTPEGYSYSSTYNPAQMGNLPPNPYAPSTTTSTPRIPNYAANSTWYQPGKNKCTYKNCIFTGSAKSVEIHMADRHLIYPPGWEKQQKGSDWDADPSLKGKTIPIQGTNIILDTPDAIEAWVAERKKRWPSSALIQEKKRKLEEAAARGQLSVQELGLFSKKRKLHDSSDAMRGQGRGRGRSHDRGRGRGRGRGTFANRPEGRDANPNQPQQATSMQQTVQSSNSDTSSSSGESEDDDAPPEAISSKPPPGTPQHASESTNPSVLTKESSQRPQIKRIPPRPKNASYVPFGPKSSLLRNLLLPDIRITVSNLSQAIRFLVDNNFLEGVELKPGQSEEKMIEVINTEC
ncbi:ccch zinc finger protein [Moniliophthora roreri]|uniref:FMR1-interacting protein 1 conserved domain-containing protein n=1 Tax=Moniliophthora roreri TaxID=221103 RepID=A0A0W0G2P2_MONRR|nr:ccch zinc finger protein [Moniliophthora roreri]